MKNIIRINLDVNERNESNIGIPLPQKVIRSKDTAVIIEMRIIGYDVNDGYTFTLLSEYTKSKRHTLYTIGDRLKIEGNVVTFVPPAELISTLEIVTNILYIEKSGVSLDFSKFHYLAQLSEVDNTVGPVKEVYDDNYQALIDELEFKYMLIEDLTAEYVAAQVAEARVGEDGTIYRFLKERLDVEHQKVIAQVGEVTNQLELTNNEIIDARGGKPTLRVRLNEIDRVDETGKHWTLIDGEWEERVGQSQLINVHGEVAWAMAEAEQAREDAIKAYEDAVAEAKRTADIEDALIRTKIQQDISAVETEMVTAKQEAKDAANQALEDAKAHADAEVQASKEHFDGLITEVESEVADAQAAADSAVEQINTAVANAGFTSLDETISSVQSISNQAQINSSTAIDNAQDAMSSASTAISDASQAKADAQAAITEAGEAVDSANTAKTNAQTALADAQTALSTARNADTKSGLAEAAANTAKTNAQTAIDDAQSALTTAGNAKTTADTLSIKVDDLEGEVELKASQTEVDGINGTVSTHTTTLSQHATAISSKAESELVDTIKGTVDTHTTEISQNATDIASKANTATVNTLTGRVDTAESNISQNATAITQRVTTTTYTTGIANKENTVLKQTTAPTHVNGRLWLDTSVTPNILKRSNGTTWIKATPTTPGEVGAYSQADGAGLAGRLTTAETNITQTATAITSKADKSTVDTLEGIVSTQGTTITQQADLIESKANQSEVDTVKGTVAGHTTTISQHANQIASKAESNSVNAIKGTVDNHTTEISQNATDIASKASSTSVNSLTGRVSTAETTISQHATAITSKASQTEVDTVKGTVAGHTTTISQHANQIASKAESSLVNTIKGTVDTHTTEISQNATDIASKASSSSVNALTGRVSTAETGISQNATDIKLKANATTVNALTGRVNTAESSISTNAGAIKLKANQSTVDTLAGTVSSLGSEFDVVAGQVSSRVWNTDIETAIDRIEVGGRNLILQSQSEIEMDSQELKNWLRLNLSRSLESGLYTVSFEAKTSNGTDIFYASLGSGSISIVFFDSAIKPTKEFTRFYFTAENDSVSTINTVIISNSISYVDASNTGTLTIKENSLKLEKGNKVSDWSPAPEDTTTLINYVESELTQKHDSITATVQSVREDLTGTTTLLNTTRTTVSGHTSTIATLRTDVNGKATTSQFNTLTSTVNGTITRVGTAEGKITQIETNVSGLQTTVASKASQTQVTQLANGLSSVVTDLDNLEIGGRNLLSANPNNWERGWINHSTGEDEGDGYHLRMKPDIKIQVEGNSEYAISGKERIAVFQYNSEGNFILRDDIQKNNLPKVIKTNQNTDYLRAFVLPVSPGLLSWSLSDVELHEYKIEKGNKATGWTPAPEDVQSQISQLSDNINLRVTKEGLLSQINIEADRTLIQSKKLVLDANSVVFTGNAFIPSAQIVSLHADKINAGTISAARLDAKTIVTDGLAANVVSSNHIIANEALVDKVFSNQASVDRLWAKAIWTNKITAMEIDAGQIKAGTITAARLNVTDLRAKILTAGVVDATQINGSAAVFNKLFSTSSATSRLVAQGAWIENANIKGINASKITAGTISADRISTSSLANLEVGGRNLMLQSHSEIVMDSQELGKWTRLDLSKQLDNGLYTVSFEAKTSNGTDTFYTSLGSGNASVIYFNRYIKPTKNFTRFYFTVEKTGTSTVNSVLMSNSISYADASNTGTLTIKENSLKLEKGNKVSDWSPAPDDIVNDLGSNGNVEIHGGNIKASTLDVGAITGNLGEFINLSLKAQNSQASLSGSSFKIESIANSQSYIEMSNVPEIRARSANSAMVVMGQGLTNYSVDNIERFYMGTKIDGTQHGIMIRKNHGWAIMRESDSFGGTPAKYYTVKSGEQRVAVVEALMRDATVTEVPTGNETQFIINNNYLARLNGFSTSTSSTIAAPWPTLTTGQLIKYAEGTPGNQSGKQSIFKVWTANNTSVSAFDAHVTFNAGYSGASDRRIKHNIQDTSVEALSHIDSLKFKEFKYNSDNRYEPLGIIAQDSGILRVKWEEMESIDIQRSIMLGLKGVQELHTIVKEQAEEIKQLKEIINQ